MHYTIIFVAVIVGVTLCFMLAESFSQSSQKQKGRRVSRRIALWSPISRAELKRNKYVTYNF